MNSFTGPDGLASFLNPENHVTPLVELPADLNPYVDLGVRCFVKLLTFLPLGNAKSAPAYRMLGAAEGAGFPDGTSVVEPSSGNVATSLAVLAPLFGMGKVRAYVSRKTPKNKIQLLRFFGVEITITDDDYTGENSNIDLCVQVAEENHWINPGQYHNPANPAAHFRWTGPQIAQQVPGAVSVVCAGLGSSGTLLGTGRYLRTLNPDVRLIGAVRKPLNFVPGVRTLSMMNEVRLDWKSIDETVEVSTVDALTQSLKLCRRGLIVGPSSGFAYAGLLSYLGHTDLEALRDVNGEIMCVFVAPDWPMTYMELYFAHLDSSNFPEVKGVAMLHP